MKNLILFALVAFAAWYGWNHRDILLHRQAGHDAVVENDTGKTIERLRVTVDGQTFVKESLPDGQKAVFPFKVNNDASFALVWQYANQAGEKNWSGGMVPKGPMLQRHIMTIGDDDNVFYRAEHKAAS